MSDENVRNALRMAFLHWNSRPFRFSSYAYPTPTVYPVSDRAAS